MCGEEYHVDRLRGDCIPCHELADDSRMAAIVVGSAVLVSIAGRIYCGTTRSPGKRGNRLAGVGGGVSMNGAESRDGSRCRDMPRGEGLSLAMQGRTVVVFLQLVSGIPLALALQGRLPAEYEDLLRYAEWATGDLYNWLPTACLGMGENSASKRLVGGAMLAPAVSLALWLVMMAVRLLHCRVGRPATAGGRFREQGALRLAITVWWLLLPPVTATIVRSLRACHGLGDGDSDGAGDGDGTAAPHFMRTDPSVRCGSDEHDDIEVLSYFLLLVYPVGVSLALAIKLYRNRDQIRLYHEARRSCAEAGVDWRLATALLGEHKGGGTGVLGGAIGGGRRPPWHVYDTLRQREVERGQLYSETLSSLFPASVANPGSWVMAPASAGEGRLEESAVMELMGALCGCMVHNAEKLGALQHAILYSDVECLAAKVDPDEAVLSKLALPATPPPARSVAKYTSLFLGHKTWWFPLVELAYRVFMVALLHALGDEGFAVQGTVAVLAALSMLAAHSQVQTLTTPESSLAALSYWAVTAVVTLLVVLKYDMALDTDTGTDSSSGVQEGKASGWLGPLLVLVTLMVPLAALVQLVRSARSRRGAGQGDSITLGNFRGKAASGAASSLGSLSMGMFAKGSQGGDVDGVEMVGGSDMTLLTPGTPPKTPESLDRNVLAAALSPGLTPIDVVRTAPRSESGSSVASSSSGDFMAMPIQPTKPPFGLGLALGMPPSSPGVDAGDDGAAQPARPASLSFSLNLSTASAMVDEQTPRGAAEIDPIEEAARIVRELDATKKAKLLGALHANGNGNGEAMKSSSRVLIVTQEDEKDPPGGRFGFDPSKAAVREASDSD